MFYLKQRCPYLSQILHLSGWKRKLDIYFTENWQLKWLCWKNNNIGWIYWRNNSGLRTNSLTKWKMMLHSQTLSWHARVENATISGKFTHTLCIVITVIRLDKIQKIRTGNCLHFFPLTFKSSLLYLFLNSPSRFLDWRQDYNHPFFLSSLHSSY